MFFDAPTKVEPSNEIAVALNANVFRAGNAANSYGFDCILPETMVLSGILVTIQGIGKHGCQIWLVCYTRREKSGEIAERCHRYVRWEGEVAHPRFVVANHIQRARGNVEARANIAGFVVRTEDHREGMPENKPGTREVPT